MFLVRVDKLNIKVGHQILFDDHNDHNDDNDDDDDDDDDDYNDDVHIC